MAAPAMAAASTAISFSQINDTFLFSSVSTSFLRSIPFSLSSRRRGRSRCNILPSCCLSSPTPLAPPPSTKLYISGLSFRTTEENLRNAFEKFGQLTELNLVMDRVANRPRGFAFVRYATEEAAKAAVEGMHGQFLDGRVVFVEVAKPSSEYKAARQRSKLY